jgi:hypothetical protein
MTIRRLVVAVAPLLAFGACATTHTFQSHWIHYPSPAAETTAAATRTLRDLGYAVESPSSGSLQGTFTENGRTIVQRVDVQPAGGESEIHVVTQGSEEDAKGARTRNAHERLLGQLDAALRGKK